MEQLIPGGQAAARKRQRNGGSVVSVVPVAGAMVALGTLQAATPGALVEQARAIAETLSKVIQDQKLFNIIQGKRHVRVEGWTTLGALLGVLPREVSVTEEWGVYTATVELIRMSDGAVLSRASAECGDADEVDRDGKPIWASRPRYARRSMALTRATGKACRLAFSWIMALAGYQSCPAEEMEDARDLRPPLTKGGQGGVLSTATPGGLSHKQLTELRGLMRQAGADEGRFCNYLKIKSIAELEASRFEPAVAALRKKLGRGEQTPPSSPPSQGGERGGNPSQGGAKARAVAP